MHVLFVHKNFPAQFGHIASYLIKHKGHRCTFVCEGAPGMVGGIRKIQYCVGGGATQKTHYCARTFENQIWHAAAIYEASKSLQKMAQLDLIVGHSGLGPTLFLPELFPGIPVINYFEYFYHAHNGGMDFKPDWPIKEGDFLRSHARNAGILLDLEYCDAGYTPTSFQKSLLPQTYRRKVRVIHDGIPTDFWCRQEVPDRRIGEQQFDPDTRIVTYVSRGLESVRGFDIFMKATKRIYQAYPQVVFLVVGSDRVYYGGDLKHIPEKSFKEHVLKQHDYDLNRVLFLGRVRPEILVKILSLSDLHIYLTVPFVLSWSLLDAMACGCTVLASDTEPVREVIQDNYNGLLFDFFNVDQLASRAVEVLKEPEAYRDLGRAAAKTVQKNYSLQVILPKMIAFYEKVVSGKPAARQEPGKR